MEDNHVEVKHNVKGRDAFVAISSSCLSACPRVHLTTSNHNEIGMGGTYSWLMHVSSAIGITGSPLLARSVGDEEELKVFKNVHGFLLINLLLSFSLVQTPD